MTTERQRELHLVLARCGFVSNPARTADTQQYVNPGDIGKLDGKLAELYTAKKKPAPVA